MRYGRKILNFIGKATAGKPKDEDALDTFDLFAQKHSLALVSGAVIVASILYAMVIWTSLVGCDAAFIVAAGQSIIEEGFLRVNPFSIFDGLSWMPQQWLSAVLYATVHSVFGYDGLAWMYVIQMAALVSSVLFVCYRMTGEIWVSCATSIGLLVGLSYFSVVSPRIFDYLALVWGFYLLMVYSGFRHGQATMPRRSVRVLACAGLCLETVLLSNLHASMWFLVPLLVVAFILSEVITRLLVRTTKRGRSTSIRILPLLVIVFLSPFLSAMTPYGRDSTFYFFNSLGSTIKLAYKIGEIYPIWELIAPNPLYVFMVICLFVATVPCFLILKDWIKTGGTKKELFNSLFYDKDKELSVLPVCCSALYLAALLMALFAARNITLFILTTSLFFAWFASRSSSSTRLALPRVALGVFTAATLFFGAYFFAAAPPCDERVSYLDTQLGQWAEGKAGKTAYTEVNYGSFLETHGIKVWRDGNAEQWTEKMNGKIDIQQIDFDLRYGAIDEGEFLDEYDFDYIFMNDKDGWISEGTMTEHGYKKETSFHDLGENTIAVWSRE